MITKEIFGTTTTGSEISKYILSNKNGFEVHLLSYGLTIQKILYPTSSKNKQDIVLGFDDIKGYESNQAYIGCIVGRNANRLSNGSIVIDDKEIQLSQNEDSKQLHGGSIGFDKKNWNCSIENNTIVANYISVHLEEGYPGEVSTTITFELLENNELKIDTLATTTAPTVVNLTRHDYFNLKDGGASDIKTHQVQVNGDFYTPTNNLSLVTGEVLPVSNTIFDLRELTNLSEHLDNNKDKLPMGFDFNYSVNTEETLKSVAKTIDTISGRALEIFSTQPGIQFYTAAYLGKIYGKNHTEYNPYHGLCLETQHFPDATKHLHFSSTIITPDTPYTQNLIYKFTA